MHNDTQLICVHESAEPVRSAQPKVAFRVRLDHSPSPRPCAPVPRLARVSDPSRVRGVVRCGAGGPFEEGRRVEGRMTQPEPVGDAAGRTGRRSEPEVFRRLVVAGRSSRSRGRAGGRAWTRVGYRLVRRRGTLVTVTESGFDRLPARVRERVRRENEGGWAEQARRSPRISGPGGDVRPEPARIFAALGDPVRLALVEALADGRPRSIAELAQGLPSPGRAWPSTCACWRERACSRPSAQAGRPASEPSPRHSSRPATASRGWRRAGTPRLAASGPRGAGLGGPHARPGRNIAVKVPLYRYDETVAYYRTVLVSPSRVRWRTARASASATSRSGSTACPTRARGDVWLELFSDEPTEALTKLGSPRRDELEPLDTVTGHWTCDPRRHVLLVRRRHSRRHMSCSFAPLMIDPRLGHVLWLPPGALRL
jgi:hypothetical protein